MYKKYALIKTENKKVQFFFHNDPLSIQHTYSSTISICQRIFEILLIYSEAVPLCFFYA